MEPKSYNVVLLGLATFDTPDEKSSKVIPIRVIKTYGGWDIRSGFLMTWDSDGLQIANRIPDDVIGITTEEDST